ncbi:hypothetical protein KJ909_00150, partial [Patescibacteria group bacterium]|nr:hypothetical protein [Patescibacteria group bacterium]
MVEVVKTETYLIAIDLPKPFPLGFGTLKQLPRVLYKIELCCNKKFFVGWGEASIDFPFVDYDAYDIYDALKKNKIDGKIIKNRKELLTDKNIRKNLLKKTPAAFAAFNMAIDDAFGKIENKNLMSFYGKRRRGMKSLYSISFMKNPSLVLQEAEKRFNQGYVPKIKVGKNISSDVEIIIKMETSKKRKFIYALDFNAQYTKKQFLKLINKLKISKVSLNKILFMEQPTTVKQGIRAMSDVKKRIRKLFKKNIVIIADESFVNLKNAITCVNNGIGLNFKIQKIGGIFYAREIEKRIKKMKKIKVNSIVGGTFPTAIGRVYDQQAVCVLDSVNMPGDGMEPSTDWFCKEKHLIRESFERKNKEGVFF